MSELRLSEVAKRYGNVTALDGLSLDIEDGEFFCLFGPSAAGKTTTLRVVAGLERADAGSVVLDGVNLTDAPVRGRDMAMVFQSFALYPHLTSRENLAYPLRESRGAAAEVRSRVDEVAGMLRITHTLERKPDTLSGGEQQRLAIGRALVRRPGLLLLDEPLTNLDAKLRHDTRAEFKRLHRELGMTILYATPDQLEALSMGQRIAVLEEGRVVQTGTPDELFDTPVDRYVATMIGSPPMNLVPARIAGDAVAPRLAVPFADLGAIRWHLDSPAGASTEWQFGIRPHDIFPVMHRTGPVFEASVHLVEPLGDVTLVDFEAADVPLRLLLPEAEALAYRPGNRVELEMNLDTTHLFEVGNGRAMTRIG